MKLHVKQLLPQRKEPRCTLAAVDGLCSLALTNILLRFLDRRKATKGLALKTLLQRGDEDKMLKCLLMICDM